MRINRLYLKNFNPIYLSLGKYEIDLDFSGVQKIVNIFIGAIGSGKTFILSHLQPFPTVGTLDIRNQDNFIIEGEDGLKVIEYQLNDHEYVITHQYLWNKTTHMVKSSLVKDGTELNPNGNQGSFKDLIAIGFGLEQNHLRLLRLGPNVTNLIQLKATERKGFVATLLQDADVYIMLYKKLNEDLRTMNSQLSLLGNKLHSLGSDDEEKLKDEFEKNKDQIAELVLQEDQLKAKVFSIQAQINLILKGTSVEEYTNRFHAYQEQHKDQSIDLDILLEKRQQCNEYKMNIDEVNRTLGSLNAEEKMLNEKKQKFEVSYREIQSELSKLNDYQKMKVNQNYVDQLSQQYQEMLSQQDGMKRELEGFSCDYTASFITLLIGDLNTTNMLMEEVCRRNPDLIKRIYQSDSSVLKWARTQMDILSYKKLQLQGEINNLRFSDQYQVIAKMYRPPFCPTDTCPYYKTHPFQLQKQIIKEATLEEQLTGILNRIQDLDGKIATYEDYAPMYAKITTLKSLWKKHVSVLTKLGAIRSKSLFDTLTNFQYRKWYDYDVLIHTVELCERRDQYFEFTTKLNQIKNELDNLQLMKDSSLIQKMEELNLRLQQEQQNLQETDDGLQWVTKQIKEYNQIYLDLSTLSIVEQDIKELESDLDGLKKELSEMEKNIALITDEKQRANNLLLSINDVHHDWAIRSERNEQIKTMLNDIRYTKEEFASRVQSREYLVEIVEAVSTKGGIPLIMIERFLNGCREIINDLIYEVFGENIEILDFIINETEFRIPYAFNGHPVEDISRLSQGQQAIVSIALSFAIMRERMFQYNIMLLDELDGPLYEHDKQKFITILLRQLQAIHAEQVFLITHSNHFHGHPVNLIMTTDEIVDKSNLITTMRIYA